MDLEYIRNDSCLFSFCARAEEGSCFKMCLLSTLFSAAAGIRRGTSSQPLRREAAVLTRTTRVILLCQSVPFVETSLLGVAAGNDPAGIKQDRVQSSHRRIWNREIVICELGDDLRLQIVPRYYIESPNTTTLHFEGQNIICFRPASSRRPKPRRVRSY